MSVSEKQLAANRRNAQKSTGPKTRRGKTLASRNSLKHGLFARTLVINSPCLNEKQKDYETLLESLNQEFRPCGAFQEFLVRNMAQCIWRHRRAIIAETAQIHERLGDLDKRSKYMSIFDYFPGKNRDNYNPAKDTEVRSFAKDILVRTDMIPTDDYAQRIVAYQARLDQQILRSFKMLMHLKKPGALGVTYENGLAKVPPYDKTNPFSDTPEPPKGGS